MGRNSTPSAAHIGPDVNMRNSQVNGAVEARLETPELAVGESSLVAQVISTNALVIWNLASISLTLKKVCLDVSRAWIRSP